MKKKKIDKLILTGGAVNLLWGVVVAFCPISCWYGYCWDISTYNVPLGIGISAAGIFMIFMAFRKGQRDYTEMFICPKCEKTATFANVPDEQCPRCQIKMEPLAGFYTRHPELKEE